MKHVYLAAVLAAFLIPQAAFACHPVLKCVEAKGGGTYTAYFGFEGGESSIAIGSNNKFSGASGCTNFGRNCGQGTHFPNNGPFEADYFGSDSSVPGQNMLPVSFSSSVTWTLSGDSVTAYTTSRPCSTPTPTATPTKTRTPSWTGTPTRTPTPHATWTPTSVATATPTKTVTPVNTATRTPTKMATALPSNTPTRTATPQATATPQPSATPTQQATSTPAAANTPTPTATPVPTDDIRIKDCAGVPGGTSVVDCCGVCGGDGTSCPELCKTIDNTEAKKKLRREVQQLTESIKKRVSQELICDKKSKTAKKRRTEAVNIARQIKTLLGGYDNTIKLCETAFCTKSSYVELSTDIQNNSSKLLKLEKLSQRATIKACCKRGSCGMGRAGPKHGQTIKDIIGSLPEQRCD